MKPVIRSAGGRGSSKKAGPRMNLGTVADSLPTRKAAIYCLERGKEVRHDFAALAGAVDRAAENLKRWGVKPGTRVGIYAPNSHHWLVYDLALIRLGVI